MCVIDEEMQALCDRETWDLISCPPQKVIGMREVNRHKIYKCGFRTMKTLKPIKFL